MKNTLTALLIALVACVADTPPEACAPIPTQTLHVGEDAFVTPCFTDESGNELTYSVTSTDRAVVSGVAGSESIILTAHMPGEAVITILASNGSLTGEVMFQAVVPNRPPEATGEFPLVKIREDREAVLNLNNYFTDPDGQVLTFTALALADGVVDFAVADSVLTITPISAGTTEIAVTATDPGGESASQNLTVIVRIHGDVLVDHFDEDRGHWKSLTDATGYEIGDGKLRLWATEAAQVGAVIWESAVDTWDITASLKFSRDGGTLVGLIAEIDHQKYETLLFFIGDDGEGPDYNVWVWDNNRSDGTAGWVTNPFLQGNHGVSDESFTELQILSSDGLYEFVIDGTRVAHIRGESVLSNTLEAVAILALPPADNKGVPILGDWITVTGVAADRMQAAAHDPRLRVIRKLSGVIR